MKKSGLLILILLCLTPFLFSQIISLGSSNQSIATRGFEMNEYDWLINPAYYDLLTRTTLFFSLDGDGTQFGTNQTGEGMRGGFFWHKAGFSPVFVLSYDNSINGDFEEETDNTQYTNTDYDLVSGTYAQIQEEVDITSIHEQKHAVVALIGGKPDGPIAFDLKLWWNLERVTEESYDYTNTYTNTAAPTENTLDTKGDCTEMTTNLQTNDNILAFEPEVGFNLGFMRSCISLGVGLYNMVGAADSSIETVTSFSGGVDPVGMDIKSVVEYSGPFYFSGAVYPGVDMNTNTSTVYLKRTRLLLNTDNTIDLGNMMNVIASASFGMSLFPENTSVVTTTNTTYNDSEVTPVETGVTEEIIRTTADYTMNLEGRASCILNKEFQPSETARFYLGAGIYYRIRSAELAKSRTRTVTTREDNDGDGAYSTDGVDIDSTYVQSGYDIQLSTNYHYISLSPRVGASYTPVAPLTFHAGAIIFMYTLLTSTSSLTTGDNNYMYEEYADHLNGDNSYDQRQIDGSDNSSLPAKSFDDHFNISINGEFGFTLNIAENFKIDAIAMSNGLEIDSFSVLGIYSY